MKRQICGAAVLFCLIIFFVNHGSANETGQVLPSQKIPLGEGGVVDEWNAHLTMDLMLGSKISAAAVYEERRVPWLYYFYPQLRELPQIPPGGLNMENLISMKPKRVILPQAYKAQAELLTKAKIPVSVFHFTDFAGLLACVEESAKLEKTPLALQRTAEYKQFVIEVLGRDPEKAKLQEPLKKTGFFAWLKSFSSEAKISGKEPRVLHISSLKPLQADGENTIIDEWIRAAGGQNALRSKGNNHEITWEQVFAWNPDVIILGSGAGKWEKDTVPQGAEFLSAVTSGRLYRNPSGTFLWDRYGVELPLQVLWARSIIQGQNPKSDSMKEKMKFFYERFFNLSLSEEELERILKGESPLKAEHPPN